MPLAYLDCFAGLSGDMMLGALVDLGLDLDRLRAIPDVLGLDGVRVTARREARHSIEGSRVIVEAPADAHPHRSWLEIRERIEGAVLDAHAKGLALAIFERLARAEARIHGVEAERVEFHEVGAADSIVDIVGTAVGVASLGLEPIHASPLPLGSGALVASRHGTLPLPAPATIECLRGVDVPVRGMTWRHETVTPTGAAIVSALATRFGPLPSIRIERVGYGVGGADPPDVPNLLRVLVGTLEPEVDRAGADEVATLEAAIDDMTPEAAGSLPARLLALGALDAVLVPALMKKGRPGFLLQVVCRPGDAERLAAAVLRETTTTGVRLARAERRKLARRGESVRTRYGEIRVKVAEVPGLGERVHPEHEDLARASIEHSVPLWEVERAVLEAWGLAKGLTSDGRKNPV